MIANTLSDNIAVLLGKGDATFDSVHYFPAGNGPAMVRLADFNEDGVLDAAVTDEFGDQVAVLIGSGTGSLSSPTFCAVQGSPVGLSVTDLEADGHLDLAVANMGSASISVLPGRGNGTFGTATHWSTPVEPAITTFGDFDSDMDIDPAVGCRGEQAICVLFNDNQLEVQSTTPARYAASAPDTTSVHAVFDQLLNPTTLDSTSFGVYGAQTGLHRGAVVWDSATRSALLDPRQGFAAGELVIAQFTKALAARSGVQFSGYSWQFATGIPSASGGAFGSAVNYPTAGEPRGMAAADFDSDGSIDIVTTGNSPASVALLRNNGDGTFAAPSYTTVNGDPMALLRAGRGHGRGH